MYLGHYQGDTLMFLNPGFVAALLNLLVILAWATLIRTDRKTFSKPGETVATLYGLFVLSLLALLSTEPAGWLYHNIANRSEAIRTAHMAITIVWGLYVSAMLSIGFWRRVLPLRLAALALFGLTAVKLLLVDMADVGQIYRIISFLVMGLLMIAASYLYHKAEKQLRRSDQGPAGQ
jgi:uncharacterized membrane protein